MKKKKTRWWVIGIVLLALVVPTICFALGEDTDPRDTIPAPGGTDAFLFYYRQITGDQVRANGKYVTDIHLNANVALARYVHYWAPTDKITIAANIIQPWGYQELRVPNSGALVNDTTTGLGDTILAAAVWYNWLKSGSNMFWSGIAAYTIAPTGEYDHNKALNLGAHRWDFRFDIVPITFKLDKFTFEGIGAIDIYTENDQYTAANLDYEQDPVYSVVLHATYDITKTLWVGASYELHNGGQTEINGVKQGDSFIEHYVMGTVGVHTTPQTQVLFQYGTDVSLNQGIPTNQFRVRFAYFW